MVRYFLRAVVGCLLLFSTIPVAAKNFEVIPLTGRVVDETGLLSAEEKSSLVQHLKDHEAKTTQQVVVATIPSLDGYRALSREEVESISGDPEDEIGESEIESSQHPELAHREGASIKEMPLYFLAIIFPLFYLFFIYIKVYKKDYTESLKKLPRRKRKQEKIFLKKATKLMGFLLVSATFLLIPLFAVIFISKTLFFTLFSGTLYWFFATFILAIAMSFGDGKGSSSNSSTSSFSSGSSSSSSFSGGGGRSGGGGASGSW